jgi:hypothetical protein
MADSTEKAQVTIPYGVVEFTAHFKRPILPAYPRSAEIIADVLNTLEPWGFTLEGVESPTATKLKDYAIVFRRNPPNVVITLGLGKVVIVAENLDWTDAEQFVAGAASALNTIVKVTGAEIKSHSLTVAIHVQFTTGSPRDIGAILHNPVTSEFLDGPIKFQGIILQREKASIIIDLSLAYPNALFVRIMREHPPEMPLKDMAAVLRQDEERLYEVLGLEGEL